MVTLVYVFVIFLFDSRRITRFYNSSLMITLYINMQLAIGPPLEISLFYSAGAAGDLSHIPRTDLNDRPTLGL